VLKTQSYFIKFFSWAGQRTSAFITVVNILYACCDAQRVLAVITMINSDAKRDSTQKKVWPSQLPTTTTKGAAVDGECCAEQALQVLPEELCHQLAARMTHVQLAAGKAVWLRTMANVARSYLP